MLSGSASAGGELILGRRESALFFKSPLSERLQDASSDFWKTVLAEFRQTIAILANNAFKTVQQSAKDKEDICRRADARQRYLTQDFTL